MADPHPWQCVLELDRDRTITAGSRGALADAVARGADTRLYTQFHWADHMGPADLDQGLIDETIDLRVMYLIADRWSAGLTPLRFPANGGLGFGAAASLSFFMYNWNGQFGIARPYFTKADRPASSPTDFGPSYRVMGEFADHDSISPSHNAVYQFECYKWLVRDDWREVYAHDADGRSISGDRGELIDAFRSGASVKTAVAGLCAALDANGPVHEVIVELGSMYHHGEKGFHSGESLPLVRIAPAAPLIYAPGNWNFGWILPRTDGVVHQLVIDPITRQVTRTAGRHAIRWLVR